MIKGELSPAKRKAFNWLTELRVECNRWGQIDYRNEDEYNAQLNRILGLIRPDYIANALTAIMEDT